MTELVNPTKYGFTEHDIRVLVSYCQYFGRSAKEKNEELIKKLIKFGHDIKRCSNG